MDNTFLAIQFLATEGTIYYNYGQRGNAMKLMPEDFTELYKRLGSSWHNDNDKLVLFEYYTDGRYNIERKKTVFDYRTRTETEKFYPYLEVDQKDVIRTYNLFVDFFEYLRVKDLERAKEQIREKLREATSILRQNVSVMRFDLLVKSDWTQLPDVTFRVENEKEMWNEYRQYLRDMSELEDWNGNTMRIAFPITPKEYLAIDPQQNVKYLTDESHFENRAMVAAKLKLLRFFDYLGLPSLVTDLDINNATGVDYQKSKEKLEKALKKIDMTLTVPDLTILGFANEENLDAMIQQVAENDNYHIEQSSPY